MSTLPPPSLRCGPAGWAFPHWDRVVYPSPKPRAFHPLDFLSRFFDVLEINSSFYQPPAPEVAKLWAAKVAHNERFRFTAKLHRRFTHERVLDAAEIERFHEALRPLEESGRLGCVLMQFPWSFRFTEENREYFIRLRRTFHAYRLVAEMRHASWMSQEALGTFVDYHVGFVNIDQPPHVKAMPPTSFLTSSIGYVRLHGRNKEHWFREYSKPAERGLRYDYLYSPAELAEWKQRIERIRSFAAETYVITNNDAGGKSVVNALQLMAMLDGHKQLAPEGLHTRYGRALWAYVERPRQQPLFEMRPVPETPAPHKAVA
ncbi:MAG: DUF72 domain-containing protein [Bryobacterales bacterium]|nr:DUF72 domain-containing protein [Bryobacterales bacterium]